MLKNGKHGKLSKHEFVWQRSVAGQRTCGFKGTLGHLNSTRDTHLA